MRNEILREMMVVILWFIRNTLSVIQMTKIYFSCVFGLCPQFLVHSSPNPWTFLSVESDKDTFSMLMRCLLEAPKDRGYSQLCLGGLELSVSHPDLWQG